MDALKIHLWRPKEQIGRQIKKLQIKVLGAIIFKFQAKFLTKNGLKRPKNQTFGSKSAVLFKLAPRCHSNQDCRSIYANTVCIKNTKIYSGFFIPFYSSKFLPWQVMDQELENGRSNHVFIHIPKYITNCNWFKKKIESITVIVKFFKNINWIDS